MRLITSILIGTAAGSVRLEPDVSGFDLQEQVRRILERPDLSGSERATLKMHLDLGIFALMSAAERRNVATVLEKVYERPTSELPDFTDDELRKAFAPFGDTDGIIRSIDEQKTAEERRRFSHLMIELAKLRSPDPTMNEDDMEPNEESDVPESPSVRSLKQKIATIEQTHKGKLRPAERDMLDSQEYFTMMDSGYRKHIQRLLSALYDESDEPIEPVTLSEIEAAIEKVERYEGASQSADVARDLANDFDSLSAAEKHRLKKFLDMEIENGESRLRWEEELHAMVDKALNEFGDRLHPFEENMLRSVRRDAPNTIEQMHGYTKFFNEVYGGSPNESPVTTEEIAEFIEEIADRTSIYKDELESIIDWPLSATRDQRIRIKGWFEEIRGWLRYAGEKRFDAYPSAERLTERVEVIKKKYEGRLHPIEIKLLDEAGDFSGLTALGRRDAAALLSRVYTETDERISKEDVENVVAKLKRRHDPLSRLDVAEEILKQFDSLTEHQKYRLGTFLLFESSRAKRNVEDLSYEIHGKLEDIEKKFGPQLLVFEHEMLHRVHKTDVYSWLNDLPFLGVLLDSIYSDAPDFDPVSKTEVLEMIAKTHTSLLGNVLDNYDSTPEITLRRLKGWYQYQEAFDAIQAAGTDH